DGDGKRSNIRVRPEGRAPPLDSGRASPSRRRHTEPGAVLGSIDYMAPEQVRDSGSVDIRADIYGLGGTLFWCLTGRTPFPPRAELAQELTSRLTQEPPALRSVQPDLNPELEAGVARMLVCQAEQRYATPPCCTRAPLPFLKPEDREQAALQTLQGAGVLPATAPGEAHVHHALVVDDEPGVRSVWRFLLEAEGIRCDEAGDGAQALAALAGRR